MTRALIVGASGMLGREVVRALHDVSVVTSRAGRAVRAGDPDWIRFDAECDPVQQLLLEEADVVVNCAGVLADEIDAANPASVHRAEVVNATFPRELAAAAAAAGARMVHISTDAVFRPDAGRCFENDHAFAEDLYGTTKLLGEPTLSNALSLRCSFIGSDPSRRRGLLEWLFAQPHGARVFGYVDQAWNGLVASQVGHVCKSLADPNVFAAARAEGPVHHLYEDPPLSKHDLLVLIAEAFRLDVTVIEAESGRPSTRLLGTRYAVLRQCLESWPPRAASLQALAGSTPRHDD